jgi:Na+:H+ antiporter, NhaA family
MLGPLREFLGTEAAGGLVLVVAAVVALVWANSPWGDSYRDLWSHELTVGSGDHALHLTLQEWINDGLMTIFFFVVGLEIKREMTTGHLATRASATLPIIAAVGGMLVPAVLFVAIADPASRGGWGVPMATDIALAVGVVAVVGERVPRAMRAFLLGLAIVDDIGAIVIIAVFYGDGIGFGWLAGAAGAFAVAVLLRATGVRWTWAYVPVGAALWYLLHEAGVHATLAGVALGLLAPSAPDDDDPDSDDTTGSVVERLEHVLHPWSSYLIVPLFALANSGIVVSWSSIDAALAERLTWAVFIGLVVGKPIGVIAATRLGEATGLARRPRGVRRRTVLGIGQAAGIGFTVALFVAELAFDDDPAQLDHAKLAILAASVTSAVLAYALLKRPIPPPSSG